MIGIFFGIFLFLICIIMLMFGEGNIGGYLGVGFVMILSLGLIFSELRKKIKDGKTSMNGENCYARILDSAKTGNFIFDKEEYKVIVAVYVPSLQKNLILEEPIGFYNYDKYPTDSYCLVLYHNNDINVKEKINESEIPSDILRILNNESVLNEYIEYKKDNKKKKNDIERQYQFKENIQNIDGVIGKSQLTVKRIILGIIIAILLVNISFDTAIFKQTIIARDYIETTAIYIDEISNEEDSMFYDCIYSFKDNQGKQHEIIVSVFEGNVPSDEIKVKYNESNPEDYYEVGSTFDKLGIIKYLVKIIVIILLIVLFFNKTLLNKINISSSRRE